MGVVPRPTALRQLRVRGIATLSIVAVLVATLACTGGPDDADPAPPGPDPALTPAAASADGSTRPRRLRRARHLRAVRRLQRARAGARSQHAARHRSRLPRGQPARRRPWPAGGALVPRRRLRARGGDRQHAAADRRRRLRADRGGRDAHVAVRGPGGRGRRGSLHRALHRGRVAARCAAGARAQPPRLLLPGDRGDGRPPHGGPRHRAHRRDVPGRLVRPRRAPGRAAGPGAPRRRARRRGGLHAQHDGREDGPARPARGRLPRR